MNTLTGKQKSFLRSLAMKEKPHFQIGKDGFTPALLAAVDDYVQANELLKITILASAGVTPEDVAARLAERDIAVIQTIGKLVVAYRPNPKRERGIVLPR